MPHLTEEECNRLEHYLGKHFSFRNIAESMGKAPSTISREVLKHRIQSRKTVETIILNNCLERVKCSNSGGRLKREIFFGEQSVPSKILRKTSRNSFAISIQNGYL